jgi:transposase-like protein
MGRRTFSREFKLSGVKLVRQQGYTFVQAAKNLGIDPASLRGEEKGTGGKGDITGEEKGGRKRGHH